jgi:hypothetical protein
MVRGIAWAGKVPSPKLGGGVAGYYKGELWVGDERIEWVGD